MKQLILSVLFAFNLGVLVFAATPEQEKAFLESYKKALETSDSKALAGFLYTKGAASDTVEFFTMMQLMNAGQKVTSIELVVPTEQELVKFNTPLEMPDGKKYKMPFKPYKLLVVATEQKGGGSSGTSTSKSPVAEKDGKLVIPVPVPAE